MKLYSDDWQIRVTTAVTIAVCLGAAWFLGPATGVHGVWFIMLSVVVGMVLGRQVGRFLFGLRQIVREMGRTDVGQVSLCSHDPSSYGANELKDESD